MNASSLIPLCAPPEVCHALRNETPETVKEHEHRLRLCLTNALDVGRKVARTDRHPGFADDHVSALSSERGAKRIGGVDRRTKLCDDDVRRLQVLLRRPVRQRIGDLPGYSEAEKRV